MEAGGGASTAVVVDGGGTDGRMRLGGGDDSGHGSSRTGSAFDDEAGVSRDRARSFCSAASRLVAEGSVAVGFAAGDVERGVVTRGSVGASSTDDGGAKGSSAWNTSMNCGMGGWRVMVKRDMSAQT